MNRMFWYVGPLIKGEFMKKNLLALLSTSFLVRASQDSESMSSDMSQAMPDVPQSTSDMMSSLSWKAKAMLYWSTLSSMHKIIISVLVALAVLWILCKLMHCRKGGSCSCGCGGGANCGCHSK